MWYFERGCVVDGSGLSWVVEAADTPLCSDSETGLSSDLFCIFHSVYISKRCHLVEEAGSSAAANALYPSSFPNTWNILTSPNNFIGCVASPSRPRQVTQSDERAICVES